MGRPKKIATVVDSAEKLDFMEDIVVFEDVIDNVTEDIMDKAVENTVGNIVENVTTRNAGDNKTISDEFNIAEMVETEESPQEEFEPLITRTDENWTEYALSFFQESELDLFGNPKVASLVRVAEKINGPIVAMITEIIDSPNKDNEFRCVATVKLSFETPIGTKTFSGTADAYPGNIKGPNTEDNVFKKFAVALSETRALGRAARHSLNLRNVVASEEYIEPTAEDWQPISSTQINSLDCLCKRLDLDIMKFVNLSKNKVSNINKVARNVAATMFSTLSNYERGECKPELKNKIDQCKGYKNNWRE